MTTEERLEKLEQELTFLREGAAVLNSIRTKRFVLADETNEPRAFLSVDDHGVALVMIGDNGMPRVLLNANGLSLRDENGMPRARILADKNQSELWLRDENGNIIWDAEL